MIIGPRVQTFILILLVVLGFVPSLHGKELSLDPHAIQMPIFDTERLKLTADYSLRHYGVESSILSNPKMIVVHYVTIQTLNDSLSFFRPSHLDHKIRHDILNGGEVNVSAHYLIDRDGTLYQLAGEDILCRHVIGFNQSAIGIENVASDAEDLTTAQVEANAALISRIVQRHPTVTYLLGHHEYRDQSLPHYRLLHEDDAAYRFTDKVDPGAYFMVQLRELLGNRYDIHLQN